jgi:hypothetical protein
MVAQARREFDNASREFQKVSKEITNGTSPLLGLPAAAQASPPRPASTPAVAPRTALPQQGKTGDQLLIEAARRLHIPTGGKTREQIQQEIIAMAQRAPPAGGDQEPPKTDDQAS